MAVPDGLRDPSTVVQRQDNTSGIVGAEGIPVRQDLDGTQIQRLGIAGADADWGPAETTLAADGEEAIATPGGVGGTRSSAGIVRSLDDQSISVVYVWANGDNIPDTVADAEASETAVVERPPGSQSDTEVVIENVSTKSDNARVFVQDESGAQNQIQYTLNFH